MSSPGRAILPVILSGGAGTRLWPLSTEAAPKQFHPLAGAETMLQMTAQRVADARLFTPPMIVAGLAHADTIAGQLAAIGLAAGLIVLEPAGRNTAAAIALAALAAPEDALLLVMPSDHVIGRGDRFLAAIERGAVHAQDGWLVTFGITPDRPETGYGYIRRGSKIGPGAYAVASFVEKPDGATARRYVEEGGFDWNGGIFLFRADAMLVALERHAPDILAQVRAAVEAGQREDGRLAPDAEAFVRVRGQSIDHAVMEAHDRVAVVPVEMKWSDLGSWDALYEIAAKDADANVLDARAVAVDSRNCLLRSSGPRVVTVGVESLIVVATPDAVLVVPRGASQRVKEGAEAVSLREAQEAEERTPASGRSPA